MVIIIENYIFKDSYRFLQEGLADIADSLTLEDFKIIKGFYKDINLLKQKGFYPYEYIDSLEKLDETQLPPIEAFYSTLKQERIAEEEYQHAQKVWQTFNCQTLRDYHKLYLQTDVLILADAFEKFREFFLTHHEIDSAYCYSAPGLTWQCGFKYTEVKLDLLSDYDMLLMFENGIRGGYSGVLGDRYVKANNKYLEDYDSSKSSNYLLYLDANNLYGGAMSQKLPTGDFKWEEPNYNWRNPPEERGCIIECDLEYPLNTKFKTQKFPLAPEKLKIRKEDLSDYQLNCLTVENKKIGNVPKLILNLKDKEKYVIHYELLKYYEYLGLKVKKIHRIISFKQEAWLKKYINFNTEQRTKATSEFEKDLWKKMSNSFYGKTMENIRGRVNVEMLKTEEEARKMFSKPNYKDHVVFNNDLIAVLNNITSVKFDKPIYLGMCILDYSKLLMYQFYYERINKLWPNNQIIGYDTDSFFLNIETEDVYEDMKLIQDDLDTSNYPKEQEYLKEIERLKEKNKVKEIEKIQDKINYFFKSGREEELKNIINLYSTKNKKVIGKFKDELGGQIMSELVFLRSKAYAFLVKNEDVKKLKGITKTTIKKSLTFDDYKNVLLKPYTKTKYLKMFLLNSDKHEMFVKEVNKKSISPFDDKRWIYNDGIKTYPHGYEELYFY